MSAKSVFVIGPGFIGWHVAEGCQATGLVRRAQHAAGIRKPGAQAVFGDLDDTPLITQHAADSDMVIHTATADHLASAAAVLDGVRQRAAAGQPTIYLHTSGTALLDDGALGAYTGDTIYADAAAAAAIDALPATQPHRCVGAGRSVESQVHVKHLARAYAVLLHALEQSGGDTAWVRANPYFFCGNGEVADVRSFERADWDQLFAAGTGPAIGLNSRSRAVRLRALGWAPREKGIGESWEQDELPAVLGEWDARPEAERTSAYAARVV